MENVKKSYTNVAAKWAVIYVITSIVITYAFQFLNVDQASPAKYLSYIPFIAFLLLTQKEYKDQLGGFLTFGQGFMSGFMYSVFGGIILAVFIYIYLGILSPQILEQSLTSQHDKFVEQGMSEDQIKNATEMGKKYGAILGAVATLFIIPIFGAIVALIGAAVFKKEPSILDIEQNAGSYTDPSV
jgi:hypothetical protein